MQLKDMRPGIITTFNVHRYNLRHYIINKDDVYFNIWYNYQGDIYPLYFTNPKDQIEFTSIDVFSYKQAKIYTDIFCEINRS